MLEEPNLEKLSRECITGTRIFALKEKKVVTQPCTVLRNSVACLDIT